MVTLTFVACWSLSTPSTTTTSPVATPFFSAVSSPSVSCTSTFRISTASPFTTQAYVAFGLRWIAAFGTMTTPWRVSMRRRAFTKRFGKSDSSSLSKVAFSFTVPVVASIWLSIAESVPVASFRPSERSQPSTASFFPAWNAVRTGGS